MKTKLGFKKLSIVIAVLMSTFMFSCKDGGVLDVPESGLTLKSSHIVQMADVVCELTAGQTINAGNVIYEKVGENLVVTYVAANGWTLSEVHLYVGPLAGATMNQKAIQIGHFPYSAVQLG